MVEKRVKISGKDLPPPFSSNARKKTIFLMGGVPLDLVAVIVPMVRSLHAVHKLIVCLFLNKQRMFLLMNF